MRFDGYVLIVYVWWCDVDYGDVVVVEYDFLFDDVFVGIEGVFLEIVF